MIASSLRRTMVLATLGVLAMGAVGLEGFWHPNAPMGEMQSYLPAITLTTVIIAAAIDGINPCAFSLLLLFIAAMLATVQTGSQDFRAVRVRLVTMGSVFIAAIFLTYLALGLGLLGSAQLLTRQHLPARLAALAAVLLGLWMVKDFFLPEWGTRLQAPKWVSEIARRSARQATTPGLVVGGVLIGLCTVPCSGAVYLGVISLLTLQPTRLLGYSYLLLYNLIFVLPLVAILLATTARPTFNRLAHWNLHHKEWVRLILGSGVAAMGLLILATA